MFPVVVVVFSVVVAGGVSALLGLFLLSASTKPWPRWASLLAALVGMAPAVAFCIWAMQSFGTSEGSTLHGIELFLVGAPLFSILAHIIAAVSKSGYLIGMAVASNLVLASPALLFVLDSSGIASSVAGVGLMAGVVAFAVPALLRCTFRRPPQQPPMYPPQQSYPPYSGY